MKFPSCCWLSPNFRWFPAWRWLEMVGWFCRDHSIIYTIFLGQYTHQLPHFMAWWCLM
jgi:hypothetical protein